MIQSSIFWLLLFGSVIVFWLLPKQIRMGFLVLVSIGYLATLAPWSVLALLGWALAFYYLAPYTLNRQRKGVWVLTVLILSILTYLAYFKYIPPLVAALASHPLEQQLVIPLGISYFTFKFIHYAIEVARKNITDRSLQNFLCYVFLFPIFTAGPIERFDHFLDNWEHEWRLDSAIDGLTRIIHGIVKRFFICEMMLRPSFGTLTSVDTLLDRLTVIPTFKVWAYLILTFLFIYFDFSAYSDIAVGSSRLFGLRIMENFNFPIIASNLSNFWKRWHMTLSGWCQTYVYMPMIGLTRNPYLAAYATFLAIGLWHSGTMTRVCWGLYHGTGVAVFMIWSQIKRKKRWRHLDKGLWRYAGIPITQVFVVTSTAFLVMEQKHGVYEAVRILAKLVFINLPSG